MFTSTVTRQVENGSRIVKRQITVQADARDSRKISVPDGSTDLQVNIAIDADQLKQLLIDTDQDLTLKVNDAGAPVQTIQPPAGQPIDWVAGDVHANPINQDVNALYVTNSSGKDATLNIEILQDSTP